MSYYRRNLPHWIPAEVPIFVTWHLAGSHPKKETGPHWLQDPRIASMVSDALLYGGQTGRYDLQAWVIMPNHVHAILRPKGEISTILQWLKGRTARVANRILGRTKSPFWQDESFDHWVRNLDELISLIAYIENNPVKLGLVDSPEQWPWSSASQTTTIDRLCHHLL